MRRVTMMRKRPPHLKPRTLRTAVNPDDIDLFRRSVADAKPLPASNKAKLEKPRATTRTHATHARIAAMNSLSDRAYETREPGDALSFSRAGVRRNVLRALRRSGATVDDEIDLHGLVVAAAKPLLVSFLDACGRCGCTRVRIIHGKGLRSPGGEGILKFMVAGWLAQREDVLAFCEAPPAHGGAGATMVLLRRGR
jgi:DNA-nicking Smr family endonuclease